MRSLRPTGSPQIQPCARIVFQASLNASIGLILSARRAGAMQASRHATAITAAVDASHTANCARSSPAGRMAPRRAQQQNASGCDAAPHQHQRTGQDSGEHMPRVGAKRQCAGRFRASAARR